MMSDIKGWKTRWARPRDSARSDFSPEVEEPRAKYAQLDAELTIRRWRRELAEIETIRCDRRRRIAAVLVFTALAIAILAGVVLR
jgi:hypothetical protein